LVLIIASSAGTGYFVGTIAETTRTTTSYFATTATLTSVTTTTLFATMTYASEHTVTRTEFGGPCGPFQTLSIDVNTLVMNMTTTACVKISFKVLYHGGNNTIGPYYPPGGILQPGLRMEKDTEVKSSDRSFSYNETDMTGRFSIVIAPASVNLTEIPVESTFDVFYLVTPHSDAKGFYDRTFPMDYCTSYALAVGYLPSEVNGSDFSSINSLAPPCANYPIIVSSVAVTNLGAMELTFPSP
jgi:hypothetical protein